MSYSYNQRKKNIKSFKKKYKKDWYNYFQIFVIELQDKILGPSIGTLEEVLQCPTQRKS